MLRVCRQTTRHLRSNLRYAVGYNLMGIGAAAAGLFGPVLAAVIMTASSLLVTARAARLLEAPEAAGEELGVRSSPPVGATSGRSLEPRGAGSKRVQRSREPATEVS